MNETIDNTQQNSGEKEAEPRQRLTLALSSIAFFAGYVLSAGPAVFVTRRIDLPLMTSIVEGLYFPLVMIVKLNVPLIGPVLQAWVRLFR